MADPWSDISFYAKSREQCERANHTSLGGGFEYGLASGPSGDFNMQSARQTDTQGWVPNQAWLESLRYYPPPELDAEFGNTGTTHGRHIPYHLENGVRLRSGLAAADPEWRPEQLQECWAPECAHRHGVHIDHIQPAILPPPAITAQGRMATGRPVDAPPHSPRKQASHSRKWEPASLLREADRRESREGRVSSESMAESQGSSRRGGEAAAGTGTEAGRTSNGGRRPRPSRHVVLAAPKRRLSQEHHLHEWEIKSRQKDFAHLQPEGAEIHNCAVEIINV